MRRPYQSPAVYRSGAVSGCSWPVRPDRYAARFDIICEYPLRLIPINSSGNGSKATLFVHPALFPAFGMMRLLLLTLLTNQLPFRLPVIEDNPEYKRNE